MKLRRSTNTNGNHSPTRFTGRRYLIGLGLVAIVLTLVTAACGGSADEALDTTTAPSATSAPDLPDPLGPGREDGDTGGGGQADDGGDGGVGPTALPTNIGRDIIFTADLRIAVTDVAAAGVEATQKIEALGGFLFGQQTIGGNEPSSVLVFKIIPEQFQTALQQLGSIGEVRNQTISADDVTERIVDLESQITTIETSVERLRALLENAGSVEELARLESQLLDRETRLEQLRGSLRTLEDRVALATITLRIEPARLRPGIEVLSTAYPGFEDEGSSCPGNAQQLTVDRGAMATVCWEIRNTGDTDLTNFQLTDTVLDVAVDDLLVVVGDPQQLLRPGQSLILAFGVEADRRIRTQTRASADPVTEDGVVLPELTVASTTSITLVGEDPGGIPGFGEGVSRSWRAFIAFVEIMVLAVGIAVPFLWAPVVVYLVWLWRKRRRDGQAGDAILTDGTPLQAAPAATSGDEAADLHENAEEQQAETTE